MVLHEAFDDGSLRKLKQQNCNIVIRL